MLAARQEDLNHLNPGPLNPPKTECSGTDMCNQPQQHPYSEMGGREENPWGELMGQPGVHGGKEEIMPQRRWQDNQRLSSDLHTRPGSHHRNT